MKRLFGTLLLGAFLAASFAQAAKPGNQVKPAHKVAQKKVKKAKQRKAKPHKAIARKAQPKKAEVKKPA